MIEPVQGYKGGEASRGDDRWMPELDGIRGLAVIFVMIWHAFVAGGGVLTGTVMENVATSGWMGVDLFFVLSGFLITGILLRTKGEPHFWSRFAIRRALRILPLYIPYGALCAVSALRSPEAVRVPWWAFFTMLQNWWIGSGTEATTITAGVTWSLAVEEQFYLLWPLAVYVLSRRQLKLFTIALIIAAPLWRLYFFFAWHKEAAYFWTLGRLDTIALGALVAIWWEEGRMDRLRLFQLASPLLTVLLGVLVVTGVVSTGGNQPIFNAAGYSLIAFTMCSWVVSARLASEGRLTRVLRTSPMVYIGKTSYGIYLFHAACFIAARGIVDAIIGPVTEGWVAGAAYLSLGVLLTFGITNMSWRHFESRVLSLKSTLAP